MQTPIIQIKNLTTRYGEKIVLDQINLDIYPHEVSVILGGSGCGKTTLLKSIIGLVEPDSGTIKLFGELFNKADEQRYTHTLRRIGVLFQNGALLNSISILENVSIPIEQHSRLDKTLIEKIVTVKLQQVNLADSAYLLPSELSGGMRKRAALARAIALDPELLFCDEPSAGLDPLTSENLDKLILTLKEQFNMTIIVVTHELASIHRIADRIIFLDQGKILFMGTLKDAKSCGISEIETFFTTGSF
ncbi:MAG: ATP-binding cassette domain-containing protein [Candidatus Marinimicrobia bacterium]|nr:ATP-binding cassette domain-containing protein [Candidatus Neomarinimicrobiota bacterium]